MRNPDDGGLTAQGRSLREMVRLQAAEMFARDAGARQVARALRVSAKSVYAWRRAGHPELVTSEWRKPAATRTNRPHRRCEVLRVSRTGNLRLIHAASCPFRCSSMTSCGVR